MLEIRFKGCNEKMMIDTFYENYSTLVEKSNQISFIRIFRIVDILVTI